MANDLNDIAPIRHSTASAVGSTAVSTAGGAIKNGAKWGIGTFLGSIALGGLIGGGALGFFALSAGAWVGMGIGALLGGFLFAPAAGTLAAVFGGAKSGGDKARQIKIENSQARMLDNQLDAQLEAYKYAALAQAPAQGPVQVYAPNTSASNNNVLPPQGSAMNPAFAQVSGIQYDGPINGQQLAAAR